MASSAVPSADVVNLTGGIETDDGRTLYGLDAETYLKLKGKSDPEWEQKVKEWIESVIGEKLESRSLYQSLKSGIVLCKMLNKLKPGIIPKFNLKSQKGTSDIHPLMEVENISLYLKACWRLGVPSTDLFTTSDLHMGRGMSAVLQNIACISRMAPSWGYKGKPLQPTVARPAPAKKWDPVDTHVGPRPAPPKPQPQTQPQPQQSSRPPAEADDSVESLKAELHALRLRIAELEGEKAFIQSQRDALKRALDSWNEQHVAHAKSTEELAAAHIAELEKQVLELKRENERLANENMALAKLQQQLQAENKNLKSKLISLTEEVEVLRTPTDNALQPPSDDVQDTNPSQSQSRYRSLTLDRKLATFKRQIEEEESKRASAKATQLIYYEKKISERLLLFAQETVRRLIVPSKEDAHVRLEEVSELVSLFKYDTGVRVFCFLINLEMPKSPKKLTDESFQALAFLITQMLTCVHEAKLRDFNSMVIVMKAASRFYVQHKDGNTVYLQDAIKSHYIFLDLFFWEQYYWMLVSKKFKSVQHAASVPNTSSKDKRFLADELKRLGKEMLKWGLKLETILHFATNMSELIGLSADMLAYVTTKIETADKKAKAKDRKKLNPE